LQRGTPPLGPRRVIELAMRVGEALEVVLNLGLVDLRVAPEDIVVPGDGDRVRLRGGDRLILRRLSLDGVLAAAEVPGRDPRYVSPEELAGLPATERSVVYRFGILLYELLAGHPPFPGTTPGEVYYHQLQPLKSRLRKRHRGLPASVDQLVARMLDHGPQGRPGDLTWILNELWDAASSLGGETPAQPADATSAASARYTPRRRSAPTRRWALAALPVVLMGGALLAWPYVIGPLTGSAPAPSRPPLADAPPVVPMPLAVPSPELPSSTPRASNSFASTQAPELPPPALPAPLSTPAGEGSATPRAEGAGSLPRVRSNAPAVTQPEIPPAPASVRVAAPPSLPVRPPATPPAPVEAPATRRALPPIEPDTASARAGPNPPLQPEATVTPPPARPSQPPDALRGDPGAIIEWLVRESPRISD
jgi:hypothetical protein